MNANAIIPGLEYAWTPYPSKNKSFYREAKRVRVLHIYKVDPDPYWSSFSRSGSTRKQTFVECVQLDENGEVIINQVTGLPKPVMTVRAREIIMQWPEHLVEKERYEQERSERVRQQELANERWRKEEEERQQQRERARLARIEEEREIKQFVADKLNINVQTIRITYDGIVISKQIVKEVLHDSKQQQGTDTSGDQEVDDLERDYI